MLKFSRYIVEQEAPQSGGILTQGRKAPTEEDLKKALEALKDYPEEQRGALEQQIRQSFEQQKAEAKAFGQAAAAERSLGTLPKEGLLDVAARSLGIQPGPVVPGVDAYKEQADTPEKAERHNKARDYFYGTSIGNVESQKKLKQLLGRSTFTGEPVTIEDIKKAGLDADEVWKSIDPGTYYANAPLEQQMQAASAGSREARFALGGIAAGVEGLQIAQEGLPGFAAGVAGVGAALGRAPAPVPTPTPGKATAAPRAPGAPPPAREAGGRVVGPGGGDVTTGKPVRSPTGVVGKALGALTAITVAVNAANAAARPVSPTPQQGIVQTTPGTPAPGGAITPTAPATPATTARPAAATPTPSGPAAPGGGAAQTGARAPAPAPVIAPVAPMAPAPAPSPTKAPAEAPREISPVPQKGIQIGDIVPAVGMVQAAKDAVQKSIEDAKKDVTGQEAPSKAEDKAKAEAEAKAKAEAEAKTPQKADQWWKDQAKDQAPAEAPAQAPAQQPARVPSPVKEPTPGETPGRVRPGRVTPPAPRTPTPPRPVPVPFSPAPKKKQAEKQEPTPSGGSGVGQMFISGLATTTKEAEPIIKSFKFRKESISPEMLIQRARLSIINEVLFSIIERKEDEEEYLPAEDEDSCGEGPMSGNAGMFVSAQEQPPEPEMPEIKFKKSRA